VESEGMVYAFEPVRPNFECLRDNVGLNSSHNVVLENRALGERPGRLKLYLPRDGVSASLRAHGGEANCDVMEAEVTTLDDFVERSAIARLDFLKADIEGAELLLLKGGIRTLERFKPTLMLEVQAHSTRLFGYLPEALFTMLRNLGYRAHYVDSGGTLATVGESEMSSLPDYNFVFVHAERRS
jgi:FkbM family methyltransferase